MSLLHVELTSLLEPLRRFWPPCLTCCGGRVPGALTGQTHSCWEQQLPDTGSLPCSRGHRELGGPQLIFFPNFIVFSSGVICSPPKFIF